MSLDVSLIVKEPQLKPASSGIFVRRNGQTVEITEEEWYLENPGVRPIKLKVKETETDEVFTANITHNLNKMAIEAGIYKALWYPEESDIVIAGDLIEPLREGLHKLKTNPSKYKKFNPDNGWGSYESLVKFVENYLNACYEYPDATIYISR